jgi:hypothetical protein
MPFPFEVPFDQVEQNLNSYVDEIFGELQSEFLTLPKGEGFIDYQVFSQGYEALKRTTNGFKSITPEEVLNIVYQVPISFIVLRTILGFTPPEWAYVATQNSNIEIKQGAIRSIDRRIRLAPLSPLRKSNGETDERIKALIETACILLNEGAPEEIPGVIHRLDKGDTKYGVQSINPLAELGVPYAMLLYERFLGRPFAGHRDSISELIGNVLETAIESALIEAGISFRKTKRAEKIPGFDQAPDFIIPDEFNPKIVIEAKITEDDGTARDKVTRVQHLHNLSMKGLTVEQAPRFEVVACIGGRGFKVRREDMKKLILATGGKVFTVQHINRLVECTELSKFKTK